MKDPHKDTRDAIGARFHLRQKLNSIIGDLAYIIEYHDNVEQQPFLDFISHCETLIAADIEKARNPLMVKAPGLEDRMATPEEIDRYEARQAADIKEGTTCPPLFPEPEPKAVRVRERGTIQCYDAYKFGSEWKIVDPKGSILNILSQSSFDHYFEFCNPTPEL